MGLGSFGWAFFPPPFRAHRELIFKRRIHELAEFHRSRNGLWKKRVKHSQLELMLVSDVFEVNGNHKTRT